MNALISIATAIGLFMMCIALMAISIAIYIAWRSIQTWVLAQFGLYVHTPEREYCIKRGGFETKPFYKNIWKAKRNNKNNGQ